MNKKEKIDFLIKNLEKMFPDAKCELNYNNKFQLLVAIILSAQATDKQVNKVTSSLFEAIKTPESILDLGVEGIRDKIKSIGLYKNKGKFLYELSKKLQNKDIPDNLEELIKLPGVGIKTAKVYLSEIYHVPYLAVDTHVHRVLNRLGFVNTKLAQETDKKADKIFSDEHKKRLHHLLIFLGRYHCIARSSRCGSCKLIDICKEGKKR